MLRGPTVAGGSEPQVATGAGPGLRLTSDRSGITPTPLSYVPFGRLPSGQGGGRQPFSLYWLGFKSQSREGYDASSAIQPPQNPRLTLSQNVGQPPYPPSTLCRAWPPCWACPPHTMAAHLAFALVLGPETNTTHTLLDCCTSTRAHPWDTRMHARAHTHTHTNSGGVPE